MANVFNYITINYEKDIYTPSIDMMQGDTGRGLIFNIASPIDGLESELSNLTATLNVVKPTGETQTVTGTIESLGNDMAKITVEPSSDLASAIDVSGLANATLVIADTTQTVTSFNFRIKIKPNPFYPKPTVRKFDVTKVSRITGVQQYEHCVQSIEFVGLNYTGNMYIVLNNDTFVKDSETEGYHNTVPLTNNTFIIGQPMTFYSGVFSCQLLGETTSNGETTKFEISPIFYIEVAESIEQGEETEYPIDPNITFGIDEYIADVKEQAKSEIEATGESVKASIPSDYSALSNEVSDLKSDMTDLATYINFRRWNLISAFHDGAIIDNNGNINTDYPSWSYTDFIPVEPNTTYTQGSINGMSTDINGGVYIALYDANKSFIERKGGNKITLLTPSNCAYVRLSVSTAYKDELVFGVQTLRLQIPQYAFPYTNFDNYGWNDGYVVLTSGGSIIKYDHASYKTSDYIYLEKGNYYILPVSEGGAYVTVYDTNLTPLSNESIQSDVTKEINVSNDSWITVSILSSQDTSVVNAEQRTLMLADNEVQKLTLIKNKKICFYGDSITCLGNDFRNTSWQGILKAYFGFTNAISVGIGGTRLCWRANETYDLSSHVLGQNLPWGATRVTTGVGTPVSMCSWERIEKTVPVDCDIVFVMGGTNDAYTTVSGSVEMSASNTTDTAWIESSKYIGGDYDIATINGAILSTIMKIHVQCPNAIVIVCTPFSGRGDNAGENQLNYASWDQTHNICEAIVKVSNLVSAPCFDLFGNCGVTPYNRATYLSDTVHPNDEGMKLIARYLIEKFRALYPNT